MIDFEWEAKFIYSVPDLDINSNVWTKQEKAIKTGIVRLPRIPEVGEIITVAPNVEMIVKNVSTNKIWLEQFEKSNIGEDFINSNTVNVIFPGSMREKKLSDSTAFNLGINTLGCFIVLGLIILGFFIFFSFF